MISKHKNWLNYIMHEIRKASFVLMILSIAFNVLLAFTPVLQVYALAGLLDYALQVQERDNFLAGAAAPLAVVIFVLVLNLIALKLNNLLKARLRINLRATYSIHLEEKKAKLTYHYLENPDSLDLMNRVLKDPESELSDSFFNLIGFVTLLLTIFSLAGSIIFHSWYTGVLIILITAPLMYIAVGRGRTSYEANQNATKHARAYEYYGEVLTGREAVLERSLYQYSNILNERWMGHFENARKIKLKAMSSWIIKASASGLISTVIFAIVICLLLYPTLKGTFSVGIFISLCNALYQLTRRMTFELAALMENLVKNREYIKETEEFLAMDETEGAVDLPACPGEEFESLVFQSVTFRYPNTDTPILCNLSFEIQKGKHYSFVGANGTGKSTIIKLLLGLYDNYEGEILLNQKSLRSYTQSKLKSMFAVAFQDFMQYQIPLYDNVAIGNINHFNQKEKVSEALRVLNLDEFVTNLKDGVDSNLGKLKSNGIDLSQGQWQRLSLARFHANSADLRILDEPTSALDPVSESHIYEEFDKLSQKKTAIFISHRLGSTKLADTIFVLHNGHIVEQGNHADLMYTNGVYAEMFNSQRMWYA